MLGVVKSDGNTNEWLTWVWLLQMKTETCCVPSWCLCRPRRSEL